MTQQVNNLREENQVLKEKQLKDLGEKIKKGQEASQLLLQVIEAKVEVYKK